MDELLFQDEESDDVKDPSAGTWKVIVADDEPEVQTVTKLILKSLKFENKGIEFINAYSGEETIERLKENPDAAVILLDVIMEKDNAGLEVVKKIREQMGNQDVRIVLRTGQPGQFPEEDLVVKYDINDYKSKTELTKPKMITTVVSALRSYKNILELNEFNHILEEKVKERTSQIEQQNSRLEQLNTEKNTLISVVAHDLRSPLNQIKGLIHLVRMEEGNLSTEQRTFLNQMLESTERLRKMISSVLDVNAIESGASNLNMERTSVGECLDYIVKNFMGLARAKNIKVEQVMEQTPLFVNVDKNYLIQVLENLLSNAIKYSESGTTVRLLSLAEKEMARISVVDEGPGISESDQKNLFTAYQTLSAKPTGGEESSGLGLSIAKRYVSLMDGEIECHSEPGKGSTFTITFKLVE
jgi:signal transduction histidine kinase